VTVKNENAKRKILNAAKRKGSTFAM